MNYRNRIMDFSLIFPFAMLVLLLLLQGCATGNSRNVEPLRAVSQPVIINEPVIINAEARADFDAAMQLVETEQYEKAVELLNKVVKAAPNSAVASINLALVYRKLGKLEQAEESLKLALNAEPENPVAHNEYALLYRKTGRFPEARGLYEKILDKHPNFNMVHKNLGILCDLYQKDYECALKHYEIYSNVAQDDKTVKIWIADLQRRLGK